MRELDNADVGLREVVRRTSCNADLNVANQESTDSIHEVHVGDALFAFVMGQVKIYFSFARLVLTKHT